MCTQLTRLLVAGVLLGESCLVAQQVCRVSLAGATRNRRVVGDVYAECPGDIINCIPFLPVEHSIPFGNWGATSNFGQKQDGHQFQGWCNNSWVRDNYGNWKLECRDGWYEWNSCYQSQWGPPNCTLFNYASCYQQATVTGNNVHGTIGYDVWTSCPYDWNGDGACDTGGCLNMTSMGTSNNFMTLYELDKCDEDELVQSLYFPATTAYTSCSIWGCSAAGSNWVTPTFYDTPSWPPIVYSEFALIYNGAYFIDQNYYCEQLKMYDPRYNCY
jgi:hypothetical protein